MSKIAAAAVATNVRETEIREFHLPEIGEDEGILKVEIVGVCGTDVDYYRKEQSPRILGHHIVGDIERIGEKAAKKWGLAPGDRVVMEEYIPCGQCKHCRTGVLRACEETDPRKNGIRYGATPLDIAPSLYGGFAQYVYLHPNAVLHKISKDVDLVEASFALPLSNGFEWMCIEGNVGPNQVVLIQGPGQQGLACALAAKYAGAEVIVTGRNTSMKRLELAKKLGVDHIINISEENLVERVKEITKGSMVDVVLDVTSGGAGPVTSSLDVANKGATIILGAYKYQKIAEWDIDEVIKKTLTIKGVRGHSYHSVEMAIECISSGKFPIKIMNSHNYPLAKTDAALKTAGGEGEPFPLLVTVSPWL
ncbi:zinc-dependent alcohol dehydrogenase [Halalkalibacterium ligniniphilum]|uniref:zinc-dependent alcohol dehydrogenase n=1 Tax=Halalkalibacterium ligniniphilum TaxID=1134413 RepID=UPI00034948CF|nr:alcohol dehydrogenase catalytic domain-containing protein [Halalkalibacterium ligniniphilum]